MNFGRIGLEEAEGAVLGHTLRLGRRAVFKKGRVLSVEDLAALREAGHADVVAARLEPGDVPEDEAAARVGAALAGEGLRVSEPFTGRCNLFAASHGVVVVAREHVDRINGVHESITLATVTPYDVVESAEMVATVKVIPFAAPEAAVAACEGIGAERGGLLSMAPLLAHRVGLVLTRLPGTHERVLDRAEAATRARVQELGSRLARVERCDHRVQPISDALQRLRRAECAPVLLIGASAIVDRNDVIPAAVVRCGGRLTHFGMPVDPGNLLLLAEWEGVKVVGVPGCARSLKPSGFDWVLRRLLAGLSPEARDLQAMGAGGLLKETGARLQPRARLELTPPPRRVAAVVLAAGQSRRMGTANKLLSEVGGRPMVARVVESLADSRVASITVVTGHEAAQVESALSAFDVELVHNPDYASGMSTSLRVGVSSLQDDVDGALICLGDMPWVRAEHVNAILDAFDPDRGRAIIVPFADRKRGNPILWASRYFAAMARLDGDVGARELLEQHRDAVHRLALDDDAVLLDVDTPEALHEADSPQARPRKPSRPVVNHAPSGGADDEGCE